MKYNYEKIKEVFEKDTDEAFRHLIALKSYCGNEIKIKGLKGWIFEQVIQFCLKEELGEGYEFEEQVKLKSKRPDLGINDKVLIEIKSHGLFSTESLQTYKNNINLAKEEGKTFLYITLVESESYYKKTVEAIGENAFLLSRGHPEVEVKGEWERFVNKIKEILYL